MPAGSVARLPASERALMGVAKAVVGLACTASALRMRPRSMWSNRQVGGCVLWRDEGEEKERRFGCVKWKWPRACVFVCNLRSPSGGLFSWVSFGSAWRLHRNPITSPILFSVWNTESLSDLFGFHSILLKTQLTTHSMSALIFYLQTINPSPCALYLT